MMDIIGESVGTFLRGLGAFLPRILAAIVILVVGWIVARILRAGVARGLTMANFPRLAKQAGIEDFLGKGGVRRSSSDVLATLVYWLVMLMVLVTAVNALRLEAASRLLGQVLLYIPNVIAAVIVIVVGMYAAGFVATLVRTAVANAGIEEAGFAAEVARYGLVIFTFAIALNQLGIGKNLIAPAVLIVFGAAGLAAAISVGLGAKDVVGRYLQKKFGKV
ncbi:MAG: mechanosensitive ion channel family protein [Gemmatimonadota bacterium]